MNKIERAVELLRELNPEIELTIEQKDDGSTLVVGGYPSFILIFDQPDANDGFIVSLNADPATVTYFLMPLIREFPELMHYGPYCEIPEDGGIVFHEEAYQLREDIILARGMEIATSRAKKQSEESSGLIVPEEKKLILGV